MSLGFTECSSKFMEGEELPWVECKFWYGLNDFKSTGKTLWMMKDLIKIPKKKWLRWREMIFYLPSKQQKYQQILRSIFTMSVKKISASIEWYGGGRWIGKNLEGSSYGLIVLSQHFPKGTEENHRNLSECCKRNNEALRHLFTLMVYSQFQITTPASV
jgi:hypothetical protein